MVPKSLIKLIDEAIIPAFILIIVKMAAILISSYFLKLNFDVNINGFAQFLPHLSFLSVQDYTLAENYSNLAMYAAAALGTLYILVKAHFLHQSHVSPKVQQKLASLNFENIITSSFHLYHQALIWLVFLWLTTAFLITSTLLKVTYMPITAIALIITINFTWIFAVDVQKEVEINKYKI